MAMVKSGWLHRQSTILRRWKRNWFDLWADGRLVFFNDQQRCDMEDELHMRVDCINIRGAAACPELNAPEAKVRDALFQIVCRDGRVVSLCAESADDALAWTMALQDARINTVSLNETSRRSSGSSCSAFTRGVLLSWFQVVSTPQVTFAQEVRPSAPPPYSDYAPPPQVRGLTCMNVSSCTHTIYTRYRRGHVEESVVVSDAFTWCTCGETSTTRSFVSIATGRGLMVSLAVPSPLSRSLLRPRTGTSWRPPRRTPPRSCTRPTGSPTPWPTPTSTQVCTAALGRTAA
uniref:pleckstrin homology domain-containing family B member 2 isoform X1 n=1 Tax=Gasterosteus aculeatus aculeatus TaxID=481459 RepID=UPI001A98648F|nr:pleckstrin homology domain-containing family B member 2 isoform X1 [Gasterosteus aculeatus aculeatus]